MTLCVDKTDLRNCYDKKCFFSPPWFLVENIFFFTAHDTHRDKECYRKRTRAFVTCTILTKFGILLQIWMNLFVAKFFVYMFSIFFLRTAHYWVFTQRVVVIPYRRFGTTYRSHLQRVENLDYWTLLRGGSLISRISVLLNANAKIWRG